MTTYKEERRRGGRNPLRGGKLPVKQIEIFLNESYNPEPKQVVEGTSFKLVSTTETTRTYWNGTQCVFVIRGTNPTMKDWSNNLSYLSGVYKNTPRFKEALQAYNKAVRDYGEKNISVLGHSQGGGSASLFPNSNEIITLNRAYKGESIPPNEYDIHATLDPVSALLNVRKPPNDIPIKSKSFNPLTNHSIDILKLLDPERMIGRGKYGDNGLTDSELEELCKYFKIKLNGIYEKSEVKELVYGNYIINLNGQSHWCAMIISPNGNFYYDSYGFIAPENLHNLMCGGSGYIWNDKQIQDINSTACGYYCIAFLKFMENPTKQMYNEFCNLFSHPKKNDKILFSILGYSKPQ
jgi:hypothetical protein